jgi:hypothetical protein
MLQPCTAMQQHSPVQGSSCAACLGCNLQCGYHAVAGSLNAKCCTLSNPSDLTNTQRQPKPHLLYKYHATSQLNIPVQTQQLYAPAATSPASWLPRVHPSGNLQPGFPPAPSHPARLHITRLSCDTAQYPTQARDLACSIKPCCTQQTLNRLSHKPGRTTLLEDLSEWAPCTTAWAPAALYKHRRLQPPTTAGELGITMISAVGDSPRTCTSPCTA